MCEHTHVYVCTCLCILRVSAWMYLHVHACKYMCSQVYACAEAGQLGGARVCRVCRWPALPKACSLQALGGVSKAMQGGALKLPSGTQAWGALGQNPP